MLCYIIIYQLLFCVIGNLLAQQNNITTVNPFVIVSWRGQVIGQTNILTRNNNPIYDSDNIFYIAITEDLTNYDFNELTLMNNNNTINNKIIDKLEFEICHKIILKQSNGLTNLQISEQIYSQTFEQSQTMSLNEQSHISNNNDTINSKNAREHDDTIISLGIMTLTGQSLVEFFELLEPTPKFYNIKSQITIKNTQQTNNISNVFSMNANKIPQININSCGKNYASLMLYKEYQQNLLLNEAINRRNLHINNNLNENMNENENENEKNSENDGSWETDTSNSQKISNENHSKVNENEYSNENESYNDSYENESLQTSIKSSNIYKNRQSMIIENEDEDEDEVSDNEMNENHKKIIEKKVFKFISDSEDDSEESSDDESFDPNLNESMIDESIIIQNENETNENETNENETNENESETNDENSITS